MLRVFLVFLASGFGDLLLLCCRDETPAFDVSRRRRVQALRTPDRPSARCPSVRNLMPLVRRTPCGKRGFARQLACSGEPNSLKVVPSYRDLQKTQGVFADVGKRFGRGHEV